MQLGVGSEAARRGVSAARLRWPLLPRGSDAYAATACALLALLCVVLEQIAAAALALVCGGLATRA